ncbi:MAG: potassium-transporting ATPase subunit KdpC [Ignavibacteria bacterium]|nr:potassium-transporting ATPase subunit KdpC [Ignavibacteria bacterium]
MIKHLQNSLLMVAAFTLICGVAFPLLVTGIAAVIAPSQRNGSMVIVKGREVGSALVGQAWTSDKYFHGRPSAIGNQPLPSGGTNRTVASAAFRKDVAVLRDSLAKQNEVEGAAIPSDLVMASASGIDPHISTEAAQVQVTRVMKARGLASSRRAHVEQLISAATDQPLVGIFGMARVNVLRLNIAMDALRQ